ncbi:hypothetical protein TNCV_3912321 [Trichonephila clavipes]|nr:hypothetical protein TNCV_3912321 [Trichonephila clavipes]
MILFNSEKEARKRSHVAAWSPPFAVTNWKGGVRPSGCQRVRQKRERESMLTLDADSGCHWEMEREAFLHPISRLLLSPCVDGPT